MFLDFNKITADLPDLLRSGTLPESENLGTQNYSRPVEAVVLGGGYDDTMFNEIKSACKGTRNVPWLRPDLSGGPPSLPLPPTYPQEIASRVKLTLKKLAEEGKMGQDGVHLY